MTTDAEDVLKHLEEAVEKLKHSVDELEKVVRGGYRVEAISNHCTYDVRKLVGIINPGNKPDGDVYLHDQT